jgi:hypothetical protein
VAWTRRLAQISTIPPSHPIAISLSPLVAFLAIAISVAASGEDATNTGSPRLWQIRSKWTFVLAASQDVRQKAIANKEPYPITSHEMIANAAVMEAVFKSAWSGNADLAPM